MLLLLPPLLLSFAMGAKFRREDMIDHHLFVGKRVYELELHGAEPQPVTFQCCPCSTVPAWQCHGDARTNHAH